MKKVLIIAGHQKSTGAFGIVSEGEKTIELRNMIVKKLKEMGITALVDSDSDVLGNVVAKIKKLVVKTDICIDIHFNSAANNMANGSEVFIPTAYSQDEFILGTKLIKAIVETIGTKNRGLKYEYQTAHKKIAMLSSFDCVNILIEVGFVSNKSDMEKYEANKETLADRLAKIIADFSKS